MRRGELVGSRKPTEGERSHGGNLKGCGVRRGGHDREHSEDKTGETSKGGRARNTRLRETMRNIRGPVCSFISNTQLSSNMRGNSKVTKMQPAREFSSLLKMNCGLPAATRDSQF